jgi:Raf kinase inhibitor-like YbhB/YbcL family protein
MQVPLLYKCDKVNPVGMNESPPLAWTPGPAGTKSYAVTLNHVGGGDHWAIWNIPVSTMSLPSNVDHTAMPAMPAGAMQSVTNLDGFNGSGYLGPCPQALNATQSYTYAVYALGVVTLGGVTATSTTTAAQTAIRAAALPGGTATLTGTQIRTP